MDFNYRLKPIICTTCGINFIGGPTAKYCPTCRADRIRQRDRERHQRKLTGRIRHIGSTDICTICGNEYTVNAGPQKHCPACQIAEAKRRSHEKWLSDYADPVKRKILLDRARQWAIVHHDRMAEILRQSYERHLEDIKNKRRKMYGVKLRPLGRAEICPKCGNEFIVRERNQKYCTTCK